MLIFEIAVTTFYTPRYMFTVVCRILFLLVVSASVAFSKPSFNKVFGDDYLKAEKYVKDHGTYFEKASAYFKVDKRFLKAVVFPELIRYSQFSDLLETHTLEWLYVEGGSKSADFSIGCFQMKPSFVETLEGLVSSDESLKEEYGFLVLNGSGSSFRKIRLARLKNEKWQFVYLCCFLETAWKHFQLFRITGEEELLRSYCAVYNAGFGHDLNTLRKRAGIPSFPYGSRYPAADQYLYSDVAVDYFRTH
jgi:hypothetical protein